VISIIVGDTLKTHFRRTAVLAAGVGLLALLPGGVGTAQAAGYSPVGALQIGVHGIPAKVNRGTTITMVIWYRQTSKDNAYPVLDGLAVGTAANGTVNRAARGFTVSLQSPVTHRWEKMAYNGAFQDYEATSGVTFKVTPGYWEHLNVRLTLAANAPEGLVQIVPLPMEGLDLLGSKGQSVDGYLSVDYPIYYTQVK
jgi:hypothetical protein